MAIWGLALGLGLQLCVQGLGLGVLGLGSRLQDLGARVQTFRLFDGFFSSLNPKLDKSENPSEPGCQKVS